MKKKKWLVGTIIVILFVSLFFVLQGTSKKEPNEMTYPIFLKTIENGLVDEVIIKNDDVMHVILLNESVYAVPNPLKADLKEFLLIKGINVKYKPSTDYTSLFSSIFILLLVFGVIVYMRRGNTENKQLIKDVNKKNIHNESIIKFENVAGNDEAKDMVKDIIDFIKTPEKYETVGAKMPRGILLYGLPGTGKTLMAKAIAGEANVPFYAMSGSDFVQMYVGVGANRVRELFKKARKSERAVIFIDEIDALGKSRSRNTSSANDEREQTLNALLTEMSGFNSGEGIVVIGATNRADTLDPALLRPGRFDRQIEVALPDRIAREEILKLYLEKKPVSEDVDLEQISRQTVMFSGAMLENLVNEAAILAANEGHNHITPKHVERAFYTVVAGMDKKNRDECIHEDEKWITAYHEAGHALIAKLLLPDMEVAKVTIIPTTKGVAGYNYNIPKDKMFKRRTEILSNIQMLLGGRAAEALAFGEDQVTTGAMNDLKEASKELYQYYSKYGMDDDHQLFYLESPNALDEKIYNKCQNKMQELYINTKQILENHKKVLETFAEQLIQKESLTGEEVEEIIKKAC